MTSRKLGLLAAGAALVAVLVAGLFYLRRSSRSCLVARSGSLFSSSLAPMEPLTPAAAAGHPTGIARPTPRDFELLRVLNEILASKNDNDRRMDTLLRHLSPAAKRLMEERYRSLAPEKRNQRGTIAFLIGRDLSTPEDVAFLGSVLSEPPCLSLADCSREDRPATGRGAEDLGTGVTLAYPQLAVLTVIDRQVSDLERGGAPGQAAGLRRIVEQATRSPVPRVAEKARALLARLKNLPG